jgi:hypothetical protein
MGKQKGESVSGATEFLVELLAFVLELVFTFLVHLG